MEYVNDKVGDTSFQDANQTVLNEEGVQIKWAFCRPDTLSDISIRRVYIPLPLRDDALILLKGFFKISDVVWTK